MSQVSTATQSAPSDFWGIEHLPDQLEVKQAKLVQGREDLDRIIALWKLQGRVIEIQPAALMGRVGSGYGFYSMLVSRKYPGEPVTGLTYILTACDADAALRIAERYNIYYLPF